MSQSQTLKTGVCLCLKPGYHVPQTYCDKVPVMPRILFRHMRTYGLSQLRRRASGEDRRHRRLFLMPAAYVFICPNNIPGIFGGYVAGRSTAYENQT